MGLFDNLTPEARLMMGAGIMDGQNLGQGLAQGAQMAMPMMLANKEKTEAAAVENKTREWLQKQYPGEDFSTMSPDMMKMYANEAFKQRFAKPTNEFKELADGTYGTWDGTKFNTLGKAQKQDDLPAAYKDWQLQQRDPAYAQHVQSTSKTGQTYEERKKIAEDLGIKPGDERYEPYVATGKFPREDQQRMTAGDKAQLYELQDKIDANKAVIANLESVLEGPEGKTLNDRAGSGWGADLQAFGARNDPTGGWLFDQETGQATTELKNIVTENSLGQLKAIFGSAPTEGERIVLRELEASTDKTPKERETILRRAVQLAKRRLATAEERAASIRDESFYQPGGKSVTSGRTSTGNTYEVLD